MKSNLIQLMRFFGLIALLLTVSPSVFSQVTDTTFVASDTIPAVQDTISIIGVGDIMMGTNYPENKLPADDGAFLMREVESILRNADVTFGNLEGVLLDSGGIPKTCKDPKVCYAFRTPVTYISNLVNAGFDMMSLANNHAGDMGAAGRRSSMKTLDEVGILHAGQLEQQTVIFKRDSLTYGLVAFAPNNNCVSLNDHENARRLVMQLDSVCDIVIVSFHGGAEGAQYQHVPRAYEPFHGENRGDVYKFSHTLIDAGADIVFGHGPHVTRGVELYKNRFIAYSLGNFCTFRGISVNGINGLAPIIKVYANPKGEFLKAEIIPTYQTYGEGVRIDPQRQVTRIIRDLSKKDFPESPLRIEENGLITYLAQ